MRREGRVVMRREGSVLMRREGLAGSLAGGPGGWRPESPGLLSFDILVVSCLGKRIRVS